MPRKKWELPARAAADHAAQVDRLRSMGIEIETPKEHSPNPDLNFEIGIGPNFRNVLFNANSWQVILVTGARIVARRTDIYLTEEIRVKVPWDGPKFILWEAPDDDLLYCRVADLFLERNQLINGQLEEGLRLRPGKPVEGFLALVADCVQLPQAYKDRTPIAIGVSLFDSIGNEYATEGMVGIDRHIEARTKALADRRKAKSLQQAAPALNGLFDGPTDGSILPAAQAEPDALQSEEGKIPAKRKFDMNQ